MSHKRDHHSPLWRNSWRTWKPSIRWGCRYLVALNVFHWHQLNAMTTIARLLTALSLRRRPGRDFFKVHFGDVFPHSGKFVLQNSSQCTLATISTRSPAQPQSGQWDAWFPVTYTITRGEFFKSHVPLFLGMVIYDYKIETKENIFQNKDKIELQQIHLSYIALTRIATLK